MPNTIPTINSKFSSALTKDSTSLTTAGSSVQAFFSSCKADLIWGVWYLIGCTLFIRLSQRVLDKGLMVSFGTMSRKIFHLLVERENNAYIRCIIPKNETA